MPRVLCNVVVSFLCCLPAAVGWSGEPADAQRTERIVVDFGGDEPVLPSSHGIGFSGSDLPRGEPLCVRVATEVPADGGGKVWGLRLDLGSTATCTYWVELEEEAADWRPFVDGLAVLRLSAKPGLSLGCELQVRPESGAGAPRRHVLSTAADFSSPVLRTAISRDGFVNIEFPLGPRGAATPADASNEPIQQRGVSRVDKLSVILTQSRATDHEDAGVVRIGSVRLAAARDAQATLADLERRAFAYFQDHCHPQTGFVRDRASNFADHGTTGSRMASISATGYYLSYLPEAVRRGWIPREEAARAARQTLEFAERVDQHHGLFYHFYDWSNGTRWGNCEVAILDSAMFLNSVMVCSVAFPELAPVADRLLKRADWGQFVIERDGKPLLSLGWTPDDGLLGPIDVRTSEAAMALLLAIGSGKVEPEVWYNTSVKTHEVAGYEVVHGQLPLFVSYYGLGWASLKGMVDQDRVDLHENAIRASLGNRRFCRDFASLQAETYHIDYGGFWGISAGDDMNETGRQVYVAPGPIFGDAGGTVWPMTALAAYPWVGTELDDDLAKWRASWIWPLVLGKYGIAPFNLESGFIGNDMIGIDLGAFLINLANYRNETIWKLWQQHPAAKSAFERIGFRPTAE